jgi:hypothetical protein
VPIAIPETVLRSTAQWMVDLRDYWHLEVPTRIHTSGLDSGGAPEWHPDFARWLGTDYRGGRSDQRWADNPEPRIRTTRAFRKLRKKAVREYEVCYRIVVLGEQIERTCDWLNERAFRNDIPLPDGKMWRGARAHYDLNDTLLLLVSGVGKVASWW